MKVIVTGSHSITDAAVVAKAIADSGFEITELICGGSQQQPNSGLERIGPGYTERGGVDDISWRWAEDNHVSAKIFPVRWKRYSHSANMVRNLEMARYADALVAIWDGSSPGTRNMIDTMKCLGKPVFAICHKP